MASTRDLVRGVGIAALASFCIGCGATSGSSHSRVVEVVNDGRYVANAPGAVEYVWEEPMVDVVEVPPGLDPEGHYYRPAHQAVVEIRQGRWRYYGEPK